MFCAVSVSLSVVKVLEKHVRISSCLVLVFFKGNSHSHGKFIERLFLLKWLYTKFFQTIFFKLFLVGDRRINKTYQPKLKSVDRFWVLGITYWKLSLGNTHSFTVCYQLTSVLYWTIPLKNTFNKLSQIFEPCNI